MTNTIVKENYTIQLKSPMGWIKINAALETADDCFTGEAKLLGMTVPLTDCVKSGSNYSFKASPRLPFGVLEVSVNADINEDGSVTGIATAPHHKPMEIKGQRS